MNPVGRLIHPHNCLSLTVPWSVYCLLTMRPYIFLLSIRFICSRHSLKTTEYIKQNSSTSLQLQKCGLLFPAQIYINEISDIFRNLCICLCLWKYGRVPGGFIFSFMNTVMRNQWVIPAVSGFPNIVQLLILDRVTRLFQSKNSDVNIIKEPYLGRVDLAAG